MEHSITLASVAELTNPSDKQVIDQFICKVRNTLWINIFRGHIDNSFQICASVILISGIIHLYFQHLPFSHCLVLAICPVVIGVIIARQKKPTLLESACYIDNRCNGRSLMTTAIELLYSDKKKDMDFSAWVIHQAAQAGRRWQPQVRKLITYTPSRMIWLTRYIAVIGIFFLLQPGAIEIPGNAKQSLKHKESTAGELSDSSSLFAAIKQLELTSFQMNHRVTSKKQNNNLSVVNKYAPSQDQQIAHQTSERPTPITKDNMRSLKEKYLVKSDHASNTIQGNTKNINEIGTQEDKVQSLSRYKDRSNTDIELVKIPLQQGDQANSDKNVVPFSKQLIPNSPNPANQTATTKSQVKSGDYNSNLSPRQQQYVIAYFKTLK